LVFLSHRWSLIQAPGLTGNFSPLAICFVDRDPPYLRISFSNRCRVLNFPPEDRVIPAFTLFLRCTRHTCIFIPFLNSYRDPLSCCTLVPTRFISPSSLLRLMVMGGRFSSSRSFPHSDVAASIRAQVRRHLQPYSDSFSPGRRDNRNDRLPRSGTSSS